MKTLKQKTVSGFKWLLVNSILQKVISVGTFAILARILSPSTFGLFALAFVAIDGLGLFKTFGLDGGLIQKKDGPEIVNHTAFFLIFAAGIFLAFICFGVAPFAAQFFDNPELGSIVRALGVIFIVSGFGRVPSALLTKRLRFRLISFIDLIGSVTNCFLATVFALLWPNVWSLVGAYVIKHSVTAGLSWYFSGYRLKWQFDLKRAKELFDFGKFLLVVNFVSYIGRNANNLVIGKMMGAAAVGFYALAANIANFVNAHFTSIISRVMFPAYSQIQDDRETVTRAYLKTIKFITMLSLPFSMVLISLPREFVLTLYGEKWISIVPLIQLFGFAQIIAPVICASETLYHGCGRPDYDFKLSTACLLVGIPLMILLTKLWGLVGTVASGLMVNWIFAPISFLLVQRLIDVKLSDLWKQFVPAGFCSVIMFGSIVLVRMVLKWYPFFGFLEVTSFISLIILSMVGVLSYALAFFFVDRAATVEVKQMIFNVGRT